MMPQSARILTTVCPIQPFLRKTVRGYGTITRSASPRRSRHTELSPFLPSCTAQRPGFSTGSRSGYLSGFVNAVCAPSLHQMARLRVTQRRPQEIQPAQHRAHLASGAAALDWPRHKDGRRTHAKSSLLHQAPRRKAQSKCSKKALQRPAEEKACTGRNQSPVMAAGGLRPRQLALISEKSQL